MIPDILFGKQAWLQSSHMVILPHRNLSRSGCDKEQFDVIYVFVVLLAQCFWAGCGHDLIRGGCDTLRPLPDNKNGEGTGIPRFLWRTLNLISPTLGYTACCNTYVVRERLSTHAYDTEKQGEPVQIDASHLRDCHHADHTWGAYTIYSCSTFLVSWVALLTRGGAHRFIKLHARA